MTDRQSAILRLVAEEGFATVEALARRFCVSGQTIRRDIIALSDAGLVQRFHGGAGPTTAVRLGPAEKRARQQSAKARIGAAAAAAIPDGSTVFLDVGTTVEAVAVALARGGGVSVVTNSLPAALALAGAPGTVVRLLGGPLRGRDGSVAGAETALALAALCFDVAIIGCSGFDLAGAPTDFDAEKIAVKRAAIAAARRVMLVADAGKFGRAAIERIGLPSAFASLVTDAAPPGGMAAVWAGLVTLA